MPTSPFTLKISRRSRAGFSLTEVAVALAIASFCLTSIVGMIPVGLLANQAASGQTVTNGIVSSVVADLRGAPLPTTATPAPTSLQYSIPIPANSKTSTSSLFFATDGSFSSTQQKNSVYMVVVSFLNNGATATTDKTSTFANISINWPIPPAATTASKCANSYQTFIALDRS